MKAITVVPKTVDSLEYGDVPEPDPSTGSILVEAVQVGRGESARREKDDAKPRVEASGAVRNIGCGVIEPSFHHGIEDFHRDSPEETDCRS